jgi:RNA polymerase sigma factor (sigma-70 family)
VDLAPLILPDAAPAAAGFAFNDVPRLTAALKKGDDAAFAWLHGEWSGRINRYCFALAAGDDSFAGEIAQAAWLRLARHGRVLHDEQALWDWIACAARHAAIDFRRKGGRYLRALSRLADWWQSPALDVPNDHADGLLFTLEAALQRLTDEERALIAARYFAGESLETIGGRHALSVRAVEGRLARLRTRLRELMAEELQRHTP